MARRGGPLSGEGSSRAEIAGFARALATRAAGDVRTDRLTRLLYSTDASNHQIVPDAVLIVKELDDLSAALATAAEFGVSVTPRGAGTGNAGGAVGPGLHIDTFPLERIEIDAEARRATVTCGAVQRHVDDAAGRHGLTFGPDTATANRATLGGMVGNNSAGARSIVYGQTRHRLEWSEMVLADGSVARFGPTNGDRMVSGIGGLGADRARQLASALEAIRARSAPLVAERYPSILRHVDGYALDELCSDRPNLARVLCGSEGTLGVFTRFGLILDERPETRALAVLSYDRLEGALEAVPSLVELGPSAVELIERTIIARSHVDATGLADATAEAVLFVEFQGDAGEPEGRVAAMGEHGASGVLRLADAADQARAWAVREAALGSAMAIGEPGIPPSFIEDTAVDPARLAAYVRELGKIIDSYGAETVMWGHASVGCLHIRPFVNIKTAAGVRDMEAMAGEVVDLVRDFHGAISGEHGDGLTRSQWLERYFGPELVSEFGALKRAFDPEGRMNPGKIVDPEPMTSNLRFGAGYRTRSLVTSIDFSDQHGLAGATEICFGAGACKKTRSGTMCPPAMVTRDERHTTRARANALRSVMAGDLPLSALASDEMKEVMGLCLGCKACQVECPVGVDMARLKVDWQWRVREMEGTRARDRAIANLRTGSAFAAPAAPLVNAALRNRAVRALLARAGVAPGRRLPSFARRRFSRIVRSDSTPDAVVFADCFTEFQEPRIGTACVTLLRAGGRRVGVVDAGCCGRVMLSMGFVEEARRAARSVTRSLLPHVRAGRRVVFLEPSCASAVVDDWRHLLPGDAEAEEVRSAVRLAEDEILDVADRLRFGPGGRVLLHGHCHQRAVFGVDSSVAAVELAPGTAVEVPDAGCCGMAGSFGYEAEHAEMSKAIGERALLPAIRAAAGAELVAPGTSCRHQVLDLAGVMPKHPVEFLAERLRP